MKKLLVTLLGLTFAMGLTVKAADADKSKDDAKAERKALIEKYDTNKDGKLDKEEKSKMTADDKEKWAKVGGGKKKDAKKEETK
ncbi:MAG TPA: hypothetical protein VLT36_19290 [Candidatus Dormibacteraeota bacterium]|nr:hypothetical protein [Candidatus Dormibacteraeota bacterium]